MRRCSFALGGARDICLRQRRHACLQAVYKGARLSLFLWPRWVNSISANVRPPCRKVRSLFLACPAFRFLCRTWLALTASQAGQICYLAGTGSEARFAVGTPRRSSARPKTVTCAAGRPHYPIARHVVLNVTGEQNSSIIADIIADRLGEFGVWGNNCL